jgi:RNA polymerase-binding transcription factor DksA
VRPTTTRCISCKEEQEHLESQMIDGRQNSKKKSPPRLRLVSVS